jgi:hypothetical protein
MPPAHVHRRRGTHGRRTHAWPSATVTTRSPGCHFLTSRTRLRGPAKGDRLPAPLANHSSAAARAAAAEWLPSCGRTLRCDNGRPPPVAADAADARSQDERLGAISSWLLPFGSRPHRRGRDTQVNGCSKHPFGPTERRLDFANSISGPVQARLGHTGAESDGKSEREPGRLNATSSLACQRRSHG